MSHLGGCVIEGITGDSGTFAPQVWDYLINTYKPKIILDIGCGAGYSLKYFLDKHIDGIGIEGYQEAINKSPVSGNIVKHDFTNGPFSIDTVFDLGWTCEFVEHVEEQYVNNFVVAFKQCRYLAMTHGVPGQNGYHHVNCQPATYWINKLQDAGFSYLEEESLKMRKLLTNTTNGGHVRNTLMLFKNSGLASTVDILPNRELYLPTKEGIDTSLAYAKSLRKKKLNDKVNFHFYWRVPLDFGRKQLLPIISTINTQYLPDVNINLWSNIDLSNNEFLKPILPYINLKMFDIKEEIKDTPLEKCKFVSNDDEKCWLGGDVFRLLTLYKYGGVYVDMDVVCLRDFNPILNQEFLYQWGSSGTHESEKEIKSNGAIMVLFKRSKLASDLLSEILTIPPNPNSTCWGTDLYYKVWQRNKFTILPCSWFNTEWGPGIPLEPFKKNASGNNSSELYDGAFTWHWHNRWNEEIEIGSKFQILEEMNYKTMGLKYEFY